MTLSQQIKECRTQAGLSQAELADKLVVSRQAVTKWESGKGSPDIENLKNMASLFDVSVDFLLGESSGPLTASVVRVPVDVQSLEPTGGKFVTTGSKAHTAVRKVYPTATITPLARQKKNSKGKSAVEWFNAIVFDGPFNLFSTADGLSNTDSYYLVEEKNRQLLVRVSKEAVESREIANPVNGKDFTIGDDNFKKFGAPLNN